MKFRFFQAAIAVIILSTMLFPAQDEAFEPKPSRALQVDYTAGLNFAYTSVPVVGIDNGFSNTLNFSYLALELDVGISDYIAVGAVAGFNSNYMKDPVDFHTLPLSLRVSDESFNSMVLGVRVKSEFFSWKDFSFAACGEYLYFKQFQKTFPIDLPVVSGEAIVKNSFTATCIELWVQYDGFSNFTVFAGPQLSLLQGKFKASEDLLELNGEEELSYEQEKKLGVVGGARFEISSHIDIDFKLNLLAKTSLSIGAFYIF